MNEIKRYKGKSKGKLIIKKCKKCHIEFEVLQLRINQGNGIYCSRECYLNDIRVSDERKKERHKLHQKKHKYNLDKNDYYNLIKKANNSCEICKIEFKNTTRYDTPCIDHCHLTNKVRGILCHRCNKTIGAFNDDITLLNNSIKYLKKHQ